MVAWKHPIDCAAINIITIKRTIYALQKVNVGFVVKVEELISTTKYYAVRATKKKE
jgi:hypothetical protein